MNKLIPLFRVGAPEGEFQISMDCTYRPNDVVPIVGKILLILVSDDMCSGYTRNDVTDFNHTNMQEQMRFKVRTMIKGQHLTI